jgi:type I restriction enzyme S subunit
MQVTSVKRVHQSDWAVSGVRFLRARDIVAASKGEESTDLLYISQMMYEQYSALSGKVKVGDLLVTGVGSIGVPYLINTEVPLYFKDGNIIWFRNESIDGVFLYYSFSAQSIQRFIRLSAGTGTVGTYTIETGRQTPVQLPSPDEQNMVGHLLANVDHLITLHQRELERLKNVKKALLEKMFA